MPDGQCTLSYPPFDQILLDNENCEYMVDGDTITITTGETDTCPPSEGVYKWTLDGDRLLFELIEDSCETRILSFSQELTRYSQGE